MVHRLTCSLILAVGTIFSCQAADQQRKNTFDNLLNGYLPPDVAISQCYQQRWVIPFPCERALAKADLDRSKDVPISYSVSEKVYNWSDFTKLTFFTHEDAYRSGKIEERLAIKQDYLNAGSMYESEHYPVTRYQVSLGKDTLTAWTYLDKPKNGKMLYRAVCTSGMPLKKTSQDIFLAMQRAYEHNRELKRQEHIQALRMARRE